MPPVESAYRSPARRSAPLPAPSTRAARHQATVLGAAAASGALGAVALGSVELAVLAGTGAIAAAAHLLRARRTRRRHASIERFLGGAAVPAEGGYASIDGRRRVREDGAGGLLFERIEPSGRVARCYRVPGASGPPRAPRAPRWVVTLHGRAVAPCCFEGLPPELGGEPRHAPAKRALLVPAGARVLVRRLDAEGREVGETLHASLPDARRQLEGEYGPHLGRLRALDGDAEDRPRADPSWEPGPAARVSL